MPNIQSGGGITLPDMFRVLYTNGVSVSHTGTLVETTIKSYTLIGGSMGVNGVLKVRVTGTSYLSNANGVIRIKFGGVEIAVLTIPSGAVLKNWTYFLKCHNIAAEDSQIWNFVEILNTAVHETIGKKTGAINTAANADIIITGDLGNVADFLYVGDATIELRPTP